MPIPTNPMKGELDNVGYNNLIPGLKMSRIETETISGSLALHPSEEPENPLFPTSNGIASDTFHSGLAPAVEFNPFFSDDSFLENKQEQQAHETFKVEDHANNSTPFSSGQAFPPTLISDGVDSWHRFDMDDAPKINVYDLKPAYAEANLIAMSDSKHQPELWEQLLDGVSSNDQKDEGVPAWELGLINSSSHEQLLDGLSSNSRKGEGIPPAWELGFMNSASQVQIQDGLSSNGGNFEGVPAWELGLINSSSQEKLPDSLLNNGGKGEGVPAWELGFINSSSQEKLPDVLSTNSGKDEVVPAWELGFINSLSQEKLQDGLLNNGKKVEGVSAWELEFINSSSQEKLPDDLSNNGGKGEGVPAWEIGFSNSSSQETLPDSILNNGGNGKGVPDWELGLINSSSQDHGFQEGLSSPVNPFLERFSSFSEPDTIGLYRHASLTMRGEVKTTGELDLFSDLEYSAGTNDRTGLTASLHEERSLPWQGHFLFEEESFTAQPDIQKPGTSSLPSFVDPQSHGPSRELRSLELERPTSPDDFCPREVKLSGNENVLSTTSLPMITTESSSKRGEKLKSLLESFVSPQQSPPHSPSKGTSSLSSPGQKGSPKRMSFSSLPELQRSSTSAKLGSKVVAGLPTWSPWKKLSGKKNKLSSSLSMGNPSTHKVAEKPQSNGGDCAKNVENSENGQVPEDNSVGSIVGTGLSASIEESKGMPSNEAFKEELSTFNKEVSMKAIAVSDLKSCIDPKTDNRVMKDANFAEAERRHAETSADDLSPSVEMKPLESERPIRSTTLPVITTETDDSGGRKLRSFLEAFVPLPRKSPPQSPSRASSSMALAGRSSSQAELRRSSTSPKPGSKAVSVGAWSTRRMLSGRINKATFSSSIGNLAIKKVLQKLQSDNKDSSQKVENSDSREDLEHNVRIDGDSTKPVERKDEGEASAEAIHVQTMVTKDSIEVPGAGAPQTQELTRASVRGSGLGEIAEIHAIESSEDANQGAISDPNMSARSMLPSLEGISLPKVASKLSKSASETRLTSPLHENGASLGFSVDSSDRKPAAMSPQAGPFIKKVVQKVRSGSSAAAGKLVSLDTGETKVKPRSLWSLCICCPSTK